MGTADHPLFVTSKRRIPENHITGRSAVVLCACEHEKLTVIKIFYNIVPDVTDSHLAPMGNATVQSGSNLTRLQTVITNKTTIHNICDIRSAFTKFPPAMEPKSSYTTVFKRAHHYPYEIESSPYSTCYRSLIVFFSHVIRIQNFISHFPTKYNICFD